MVIPNNARPPAARGFTLVEAAISTIILSVMVVASLQTVGAAAKSQRLLLDQRTGQTLASDLMAEILQNAYLEPVDPPVFGREAGETDSARANYDDLDDYDGWNKSPITDKNDVVIPGYTGWKRKVTVNQVDPLTLTNIGKSPDTGLKEITVEVTSPSGKSTIIKALRAKQGSYDIAPPVDTTSVEWIGIRMKIGPSAPSMLSGVDLLNQPVATP